ncbi:tetratricopeptide repeat-containing sensor histidine kinase [Flavobacterium sp. 1355]|uniref:tetratricopeptide repeat-containing sensor histidine kinase n=1 Tax=Flavobacterium sp. 1355 TaxID=2806571 RepID=UPI001AE4015A|nr:tetratricopeptide repeat-containing sensor histidine kinase [Flavobacterium sp. 1355]MBP1224828.1 signal transduction histidine kinase [Flavobacterium sp. 1355]
MLREKKTGINFLVVLLLFFFPFILFSQKRLNESSLKIEVNKEKIKYKEEINFDKAQKFFFEKEWDSTLVYSMKQLTKNNALELNDYCHYFRAVSFLRKKLFKEAKNEFRLVSKKFAFYHNVSFFLGEIALEQNEFKLALGYFNFIEKLPESTYDFKKSDVLQNIGLCYLHLNEFSKAEDYLIENSELHEAQKDTLLLAESYLILANLYYVQYNDNKAIPYFEKAYALSKKIKSFEIKRMAAKNMAAVEENRKNFQAALVYRKEYEIWKDSLNDQNKVWAIADLEKKFAVKQKQKQVDILQAENKVKAAERNGFLASSVLLFILFGTGVYFYRQKIKNNKIILAQKNELDELNATKDKLFSIVSHDLRSSVNALKTSNGKLLENLESKNFSELDVLLHNNSTIANGAYNLLDNLLNWALLQTKQAYFYQESLHLASIVQHVEYNYKPLMLNKNIDFKNDVNTSDYVYADMDSLKIVIRNFLDNAIKFSNENGSISIYSRPSSEEFCYLVIEDSGLGMSKATKEELLKETVLLSKKKNDDIIGTGLGMQLCKSMINKNGGKLEIESEENVGTKIIIALPKFKNNG